MIGALLGGVGLFLLGMELLTDGLQTAAGDGIRNALRRYTRSRASGLAVGAAATAIAQSSSATTLAVIGFVGAGMLPFEQALAVIYGANVGTTVTAWIVASVGLKVSMSWFALPIVGTGAVTKLFTRGRRSAIGAAIAGFGLIFVGIDVLQTGMAGIATTFDPRQLPLDGVGGRIVLVLLGIVTTVVMQSSSAAVATTLTAVNSGALTLEQAAAVVIGQNVGTTVTAIIGAVGGSVPARRVAAGHLVFNVGTGVLALLLLPWFVALVNAWVGPGDPSVAISGFHTAFNVLGVAIFLPLTGQLARALVRYLPDRGSALTSKLSRAGASLPAVSVEAARLTTDDVGRATLELAARTLQPGEGAVRGEIDAEAIRSALLAVRDHLRDVRSDPATPEVYRAHTSVLHALDHLRRIVDALDEAENETTARATPHIRALAEELAPRLTVAATWLGADADVPAPPIHEASRALAERRRVERPKTLARIASGELTAQEGDAQLAAVAWIDRLGYHAWRAIHHLHNADRGVAQAPQPPSAEPRDREETDETLR